MLGDVASVLNVVLDIPPTKPMRVQLTEIVTNKQRPKSGNFEYFKYIRERLLLISVYNVLLILDMHTHLPLNNCQSHNKFQ